jgi:N-acetylglutamate synthase
MIRLSDSDVGRRVVVRYRIPAGLATDVVGRLERWADGVLSVRRADGALVSVPITRVVAAKPVPARPLIRREVRNLEAAAARGWRAVETSSVGGWLLRAAGGFTGRANSCLPLSDPGMPLADAVEAVERWYDARRLVPTFQIPAPLGAGLDEHLDSAGWPAAAEDVLVMVIAVDDLAARERADLPPVLVTAHPDAAWLAAYHYRGSTLPPNALQVLVNADPVGFASVDVAGSRVAVARGAVSDAPDGRRWLGLTAVEVAAVSRRHGFGSQVMAGLAQWGREHGATDVYVQVAEPNTAAVETYLRLGFTEHHRYHYRRRAVTPSPGPVRR